MSKELNDKLATLKLAEATFKRALDTNSYAKKDRQKIFQEIEKIKKEIEITKFKIKIEKELSK